jgi:hypothetical protein
MPRTAHDIRITEEIAEVILVEKLEDIQRASGKFFEAKTSVIVPAPSCFATCTNGNYVR